MRLILMRHAKSDWSHAGLSDHARPLNRRGRAASKALGEWLRAKGYLPGEALCSSSQRTGETLLGLELSEAPKTHFLSELYHAEAQEMLDLLRGATEPTVLMVGHNPGICEMANRLVLDPPAHPRFLDYPTGATLVCDFDIAGWQDVDWFTGIVADFAIPRELMADT